MKTSNRLTRRSFFAAAAAVPLAAAPAKKIPVGLELYSVRKELAEDLMGTVRAVAEMGYDGVEFYSPYYKWTTAYAKDVRKLLDDLGIECYSTHNSHQYFTAENLPHAIELNEIIGSKLISMASAGKRETLDDWRQVAELLSEAAPTLASAGMRAGYHNHQVEFRLLDGQRPIELIAAGTPKSVMLQLDVGTCVEVGQDPVAWIKKNPGRFSSVHCKEWDADKGYRVLFGDGDAPWKDIFAAAESVGGVEQYLVEQEGYDLPALETAKICLANFRKLHG